MRYCSNYGSFALAKCSGRRATTNKAGQCHNCKHVGNHLDELARNDLRSLQLDLQRFRSGKKQAGDCHTNRLPPAEDDCCKRDESAASAHAVGELVLVECQVRTAQRRECSTQQEAAQSQTRHADTER